MIQNNLTKFQEEIYSVIQKALPPGWTANYQTFLGKFVFTIYGGTDAISNQQTLLATVCYDEKAEGFSINPICLSNDQRETIVSGLKANSPCEVFFENDKSSRIKPATLKYEGLTPSDFSTRQLEFISQIRSTVPNGWLLFYEKNTDLTVKCFYGSNGGNVNDRLICTLAFKEDARIVTVHFETYALNTERTYIDIAVRNTGLNRYNI